MSFFPGLQHLLVGILPEDVPDDHNGLLDNVVDLGLDEIQQGAHAALCGLLWGKGKKQRGSAPFLTSPISLSLKDGRQFEEGTYLNFDGAAPNGTHSFADKVHIHLRGVFLEFCQDLFEYTIKI